MPSLWDLLTPSGVTSRTLVPPHLNALLNSLGTENPPGPVGKAKATSPTPLPELFGASVPIQAEFAYVFTLEGGADNPTGFVLDLTPTTPVELLLTAAGVEPARRSAPAGGPLGRVSYEPDPAAAPVRLALGDTLRVRGTLNGVATIGPAAAMTMNLIPPDVLLPLGFGLSVPAGVTLSATQGVVASIDGTLVLPAEVPLVGGIPIPVSIPFAGGLDADVTVAVPAANGMPALQATLGWHDAGATSIDAAVPTSGELVLAIPVDGVVPGQASGLRLDGPERVEVRARFARPAGTPSGLEVTVGVESSQPGGVVHVEGTVLPVRLTATALALATAMVSDAEPAGAVPSSEVPLPALLAAATAVATAFTSWGQVTLHAVSVTAAATGTLIISADVSVALQVTGLNQGPLLQVTMDPDRPLRVRWRGIRVTLDPTKSDADLAAVSFDEARVDVEDPGGWHVQSPMSLLEVVGTRSGHGSTWIEIDLRFALDLGPVTVSGATLRATFEGGKPTLALRGMRASVNLPGVLDGEGEVSLAPDGLDLALAATLTPLQLGVLAVFRTHEQDGVRRIEFAFGVDLPGPLPLGPTGLGLFGVLGAVGINATMPSLDVPDPAAALLEWQPWDQLATKAGSLTLGAGLVIGTAPDLAQSFSSLAVLGVSAPDLALRAGLDARILSGRHRLAELRTLHGSPEPEPGISLRGALSADSSALLLALRADYRIPALLEVRVPVAMRFPYRSADWHLHVGTDNGLHRPPGPASARVLPGLLDIGGWAFLMVHGAGIKDLQPSGFDLGGFSVAAGVGFRISLGAAPIAWAQVDGSVVAAVATDPYLVMASGRVGGSLHLGPFSIGVDTDVNLQAGPGGYRKLHARVCGEVDLWLTTLRGCVSIDISSGDATVPDPGLEEWPFPEVTLADGLGRALTHPDENPLRPGEDGPLRPAAAWQGDPLHWTKAPAVWPDTIPLLTFPVAPLCAPGVPQPTPPVHDGRTGSERLAYTWTLDQVRLSRVDASGSPVESVALDKAAWQVPVGVPTDSAGIATNRQLALLTTHRALWARYRGDGGEGLSLDADPLEPVAGLCRLARQAPPGWVLGVDAASGEPAAPWRVPPESRALGAFPRVRSSIDAPSLLVTTRSGGVVWDIARQRSLGLPGRPDAGGPLRYKSGQAAPPREFAGALRLPWIDIEIRDDDRSKGLLDLRVADEIVFSESVDQGDIWLLVPEGSSALITTDPTGWTVQPGPADGAGRQYVVLQAGPGVERPALLGAVWERPPWLPIDLLGAELLPAQGLLAWDSSLRTARDAAARDAAEVTAGRPGANRTLLKQGSRYRVDVTLHGRRTSTDPAIPTRDLGPVTRQYAFSTAGAQESAGPVPSGSLPWRTYAPAHPMLAQHFRRDLFDPAYLQRYLIGYTPADRTTHWFTGDPVAAHFSAGHLIELASAYDRVVGLRVMRTDTAAGAPEAPAWQPSPMLGALLTAPAFAIDKRIAARVQAGGCAVPGDGGSVVVGFPLASSATYDLSAAFPPSGRGTPAAAECLPAMVFTTSAFASPSELLQSLGFGQASSGSAHGDLRAGNLPALGAGAVVSDGALDHALNSLGLAGLPPATSPRSSIVWVDHPTGWAVAGVLLEAPEPLHRGERLSLDTVSVGATTLPVLWRDRAGARLLWLVSGEPLTFGSTVTVTLAVRDSGTPGLWTLEVQPAPRGAGVLL